MLGRREGPKSCGLSGRGSVVTPWEGNLTDGEAKQLGVSALVSRAAVAGIINHCPAVASAW